MNPLVEVLMTAFHPARTSEYTPKFGTPIQKAALAVGAVFVAVGVLGFVPGITTNYDQLTFRRGARLRPGVIARQTTSKGSRVIVLR